MAKSADALLTLTHMDTGVYFYHRNDERAFFEWLGRIPCVEEYRGEGQQGLVVYLKRKPRKDELRELLAICQRYGVDMRQLAKFETDTNRQWFRDLRNIGIIKCLDDLSRHTSMEVNETGRPDMGADSSPQTTPLRSLEPLAEALAVPLKRQTD